MIDIKKFKVSLKEKMGNLFKDAQWDGFSRITEKYFSSGGDDIRHLAYILATAFHETAATMKPITEYGSKKYLTGKKYWPYIGRGYVQLTWDFNYAKYGIKNNPERALEPDLSAFIIVDGMQKGIFTGKKLSQYFSATVTDPIGARKIVNGTDKDKLIAGYYYKIIAALKESMETDIFADDIGLVGIDQSVKYPKIKKPQKELSKGNGPRITWERCKEILDANKCDTTKVCLLGIRGYYLDSMGVKGKNDRGIYDDALIWWHPEGYMTFRANNDASKYRKGKGSGAEKGMASLNAGVWLYKAGIHYGSVPHPAFRQAGPVKITRDGTNGNYQDTLESSINIHRGGNSGTSSAGCQTVPTPQWDAFKSLGDSLLKQYGQKTFQYCLVEEEKLRQGKLNQRS